MENATILVIDDNSEVRLSAAFFLEEHGFDVIEAETPELAKPLIASNKVALALLDMNFTRDTTSGNEGLAFLHWLQTQSHQVPVICITGWGNVSLAVSAMQLGACDFLEKPWDNQQLLEAIQQQLTITAKQSSATQQQAPATEFQWHSTAMQGLYKQLAKVAKTDARVLLTGPSGVGKSYLAKWLHQHSNRADGPWVEVNMGAVPESLFESEMFGHSKGAFTDAKQHRVGRFKMAQGGTLFLDEVVTIPLALQAKLLRVLENGCFEVVGSSQTQQTDCRLICATNGALEQLVADGKFREDLFYRINTIVINVPRLAERYGDIVPLAEFFVAKFSHQYGEPVRPLSDAVKAALVEYTWPGNIRELSHVIERAVLMAEGNDIALSDCQLRFKSAPTLVSDGEGQTLQAVEREMVEQAMLRAQGNVTVAAKALGLTASSLYRRLEKYGLKSTS
ncbi:sigma-54 dependent transcriptional regulator [Pseudoalteromonas piscicida]|uniref:sigma-54-dependent transcriptional regulator n=1 Tax=Pseudoalteromonas piscicida TaxID=43662 RepID=UPI0030AE2AAD